MGEQAQNHDGQGVLRLRLLGKPRLLYRSTSLADELAKKEQALLVYLACQPGKRFSRDHLATLLWGETTQSRARYNLRRALWHLRSALKEVGLPPEEYLHTQDDAVFVPAAAPYRVDVLDFERELQACLQDLSAQLSAASDVVRRVDKALDRYRGEFLRGFSVSQAPDFEEWLVLERERLFLLLLRALTSLIQGFIAWGERDEAIAACQRLLELDPLQEDIHRLLMRLYWETGQRAHALRQYRTYQDLLERELGVEPLAETEELYQRILERESSPRTVSSLTLTSRLTVPTAAPESLPRPRLLDRLDRGLSVPLTLLSAPPGYGKTTLLAQWLARSQDDEEVLFAWYRVSEADNAPLAFIEGLATSLARLHPAAGEALREVYGIAALQGSSRQAAGIVVNAIASLEPAPLVMILDDLEHMTNPDSQEVLRFLLAHLPANGHLYLATRVDPLLPLPRLRIRGQLLELRASELRFTEEEARALLEQVPDLRLDPAEIDELVARAEGWIAPLWLATNALGRFAASLDDVWDGTFAYLRQEVLALQPSEIRDFLLRSAVLDHLTPSLCETVVEVPPGIDNAAEWLSELERRNLFLRRTAQGELGEEPRYVYHPLFLAFLRAELRYASTVEVTSIHRRAGAFWEHQGDLAQALFHFRQAGDDLETARLLEKEAPLYLREGRVEPLAHWLEQLGPEVWEERPRLTLSTGQLRQAEGRLDAARRLYRQAVRDFEARGDAVAQGDALLALADLALLRGRYAEGIGFAEQALERWDASNWERRARAWSTLGQLQACQGAFSAAEASLSEGERAVQERDHPLLTFRLLRLRAWVAYLRGDYHRAMGLNRLAEQEAGQDVPARVVAAFRNPVPSILREWGETAPAWRAAQQRQEAARQGEDRLARVYASLDLGRLHLAREELAEAQSAFRQALAEAEAAGEDGLGRLAAQIDLVYVGVLRGQASAVVELAADAWRQCRARDATPLELALARLGPPLARAGDSAPMTDTERSLLLEAHRTFEALGFGYGRFATVLLLGLSYGPRSAGVADWPEQARRYLGEALALAAAEGYVQTLVTARRLTLPGLLFALRAGIEPRFVTRVLARMGSDALEGVFQLVRSDDSTVRERAVEALGALDVSSDVLDELARPPDLDGRDASCSE